MTAPIDHLDRQGATSQVGVLRMFTRACVAEWTRLWSVRSTWWFCLTAAVVMVGLGAIAGLNAGAAAKGDAAWLAAQISALPAQFALLALALSTVTSDYQSGGIIPTLQWTPRRNVVFIARSFIAVAVATALGVSLAALASLTAFVAASPFLSLPLAEGLEVLSRVAVVFGAGAALVVGLGFMLRNTAGGLVSAFLLMLLLPVLLPQFGYDWLTSFADRLPGTGALYLLLQEPTSRGFSNLEAVLTMLAWAAAAQALGWLRLTRDDANR